MNSTAEVIEGALKSDGTVILDQKPSLPPGRVTITLQVLPVATPGRGLADVIDEIHQAQQARSFQGRSVEAIDAERREAEDAYEQKLTAARSGSPTSPTGSP
jgi:hypothetical protein